jgi:hypothetical protein
MEKIFKAKRIDTGEWVEFDLFDGLSAITWEIFDKNTICQFTGIYAANGKIFENDYIKPSLPRKDREYLVHYCNREHCLKIEGDPICYAFDWNLNSLTLTGHNIHDKD